jgi:hypothetical protein
VRFYTRQKAVTSGWSTRIRAGAEFKMPTMAYWGVSGPPR